MKLKIYIFVAGVLVFSSLLISYDSVSVPEWKIRVVNERGEVVTNRSVNQRWADPSLEWIQPEHTSSQPTDRAGYVIFPARTVNASLLKRLLGKLVQMFSFINLHASTTPYAFIISDRDGFAMYREGKDLESQIVVKD